MLFGFFFLGGIRGRVSFSEVSFVLVFFCFGLFVVISICNRRYCLRGLLFKTSRLPVAGVGGLTLCFLLWAE